MLIIAILIFFFFVIVLKVKLRILKEVFRGWRDDPNGSFRNDTRRLPARTFGRRVLILRAGRTSSDRDFAFRDVFGWIRNVLSLPVKTTARKNESIKGSFWGSFELRQTKVQKQTLKMASTRKQIDGLRGGTKT